MRWEGVRWFHLAQDMDKGRVPVLCYEASGFIKCDQIYWLAEEVSVSSSKRILLMELLN
jgi:hypothetical protein